MLKYRLLISGVIMLMLSIILVAITDNNHSICDFNKRFLKVLSKKKQLVENLSAEISSHSSYDRIIEKANKNNLVLFYFENDSLLFWSSNKVSIQPLKQKLKEAKNLLAINNSIYYIHKSGKEGIGHTIGLILIANDYPYTNKYLKSGIIKDFECFTETRIVSKEEGGVRITDQNGKYLFSIDYIVNKAKEPIQSIVVSLLFFLGISLILFYFFKRIRKGILKRIFPIVPLLISLALILFRYIQLVLGVKVRGASLFDPFLYADSYLVPSLGDLLLNSIIVLYTAFVIIECVKYLKHHRQHNNLIGFISMNIVSFLFLIYAQYFFRSLIINSNLTLEIKALESVTFQSLIAYLIIGMNYFAFGYVLKGSFRFGVENMGLKKCLLAVFVQWLLMLIVVHAIGFSVDYLTILVLPVLFAFIFYLNTRDRFENRNSIIVLSVLFFTIYSSLFLMFSSKEKNKAIMASYAINIDNEHDAIAEYLFEGMGLKMQNDSILQSLTYQEEVSIEQIYSLLKKKYFNGFWNKYDIQLTICSPTDSVLLDYHNNSWAYCYGFFENIIADIGQEIVEDRFYYLDNKTGKISYIAKVKFKENTKKEVSLFIELNSKLYNDVLGYPELLLNRRINERSLFDKFSYAKYYKGELVSQSGDYSYNNEILDGSFKIRPENNHFVQDEKEGYLHYVYYPDQDNVLLISNKEASFFDLLIVFSYLFFFYYGIIVLIILLEKWLTPGTGFFSNLRSKIQFSVVAILFASLVLIAISTIVLYVGNYKKNQNEILKEKIQSVWIELSHKLAYEDELTKEWSQGKYDNLDQLLIKFSDVFYSDINLYNPKGQLIASSRPLIFSSGLQAEIIDPRAYFALSNNEEKMFFHEEKIGELSYLSAYLPFKNSNGKLLAYLNLPYFTKQKELQNNLTALIVTVVNIYVLLILLAIFATVFISNQVTRPLSLLQLKFRQLQHGGGYEKINYSKNDEIGQLVEEYNVMVEELQRSVELLAKKERESAWREMARQIAHEIKNPLTPMKLSVQQLYRSWKSGEKSYEEYLEKSTKTLLQQIDNLSNIASEFSNFARMPVANFQRFNLIPLLHNVKGLFESNEQHNIVFSPEKTEAFVYADEEQLSRAFINLVKNALQSIPNNRKGKITIQVDNNEEQVTIKIIDNGKGISEEVQKKIYMPNFTTKSSGAGLGLAIVKKIIDDSKGEIHYETEIDVGTTFIITLPLARQ